MHVFLLGRIMLSDLHNLRLYGPRSLENGLKSYQGLPASRFFPYIFTSPLELAAYTTLPKLLVFVQRALTSRE